ncbi:hypothetical protein C8J56DRAFT_170756 [Mycena floridula]|nr:hypothetical protein C8J56DRAFT_170756 [Mycena floridula]
MVESQQLDDKDVGPPIPLELLLAILEPLVPEMAVTLISLSRDLQPFIERLLYRSINLRTDRKMWQFVSLIRSGSRPLSFYQDRIRNVCIVTSVYNIEAVLTILSACRDVESFAFRALDTTKPRDIKILYSALSKAFRPTRLSLGFIHFKKASALGLGWLNKVTHLQLMSSAQFVDLRFNDNVLQHLPQLTHLSCHRDNLSFPGDEASLFASSLRLSDKFVVFIVWASTRPRRASWIQVHDPRIVLGFFGRERWYGAENPPDYVLTGLDPFHPWRYLNDWSRKPSRDIDMWEMAEERVELQRWLQSEV